MSQFVDNLVEVFAPFGAITVRRMFGGFGVYHDGLMFGLVADDELYLKVDEASVGAFLEQGSVPFETSMRGKRVKMSYYSAPEGMLDDPDEASAWAARAFDAALRAKQRTAVRTPKAKQQRTARASTLMPSSPVAPTEPFATMLQGGHPNSLGRTVEVVDRVLAEPARLDELVRCYDSADEVVRLRTSSALKRVCSVHPAWLVPYVDVLLGEVAAIEQPSAQWTLAQLLVVLEDRLTDAQRSKATEVLKRNLETAGDWIVLIQTMQTLAGWAASDPGLRAWLAPQLRRLAKDPRRSVSGKARKIETSDLNGETRPGRVRGSPRGRGDRDDPSPA